MNTPMPCAPIRSRLTSLGLTAAIGMGLLGCAQVASSSAGSSIDLKGSEWRLEAIGSQSALPDAQASLRFLEGNRIAGNGSCNKFSGQSTQSKGGFAVGPLVSTKMACGEKLMGQESAFLDQLEKANRLELSANSLFVHTSDPAKTLRFSRLP